LFVREENNDNEEIAARQNEMEDARNPTGPTGMAKMMRMKIMATKTSMVMESKKK